MYHRGDLRILIILHVENEGPGALGEGFAALGAEIHTARLYAGDPLPQDPREADAIVSMGGPMDVYAEERYPFLREETAFLARAIEAEVPLLGVCLGAQIIAKAAGAPVRLGAAKELGWCEVDLTEEGRRDGLFLALPESFVVFQWHEDTFEIPAGGVRLASSPECANQAFRIRRAYGLQFHLEATREMLAAWFEPPPRAVPYLMTYRRLEHDLVRQARFLSENFLRVARRAQSHGG